MAGSSPLLVRHDVPGGPSPRQHFVTQPDGWCWCSPCFQSIWIVHHETCLGCNGYGLWLDEAHAVVWDKPCPECGGLGWHPCDSCRASASSPQ